MRLRRATKENLESMMGWIDSEQACRIWAGEGFRFPFTTDQFFKDLGFPEYETYVLADKNDIPVGLGQIIHRSGRLHLARILVMPALRGKGYGRRLCEELIKEGRARYGNKAFSLNVYRHNTVARQLYEKLGFRPAPDQGQAASNDSVFMIMAEIPPP